MVALAHDVSKLTERYQTTVPSGVRKHLQLGKGDTIRYRTEANGRVYIEAVRDAPDPAITAFLDLLEADMQAHPERLKAFDGALYDRLKTLVDDVDIDLDGALSANDE